MEIKDAPIGQRVRALRISRGMTQKSLADGIVTRNMLSLIESGDAAPSLGTLASLAKRLNVPIGYFFASGDEEVSHFLKMSMIDDIRRRYGEGDFAECLALCATLTHPDDEILFLSAECHLALAQKSFQCYALASASASLERAVRAAAKCMYQPGRISQTAEYLTLLIRSVSLAEIPARLAQSASFSASCIPAEFFAYVCALRHFAAGDAALGTAVAQSGLISTPAYRELLDGHARIAGGRTDEAAALLRRLLTTPQLGFFTKLHTLNALENCASSVGDFKSAYQYSTAKMRLLASFAK